jgi:hypothetical protein
MSAAYTREARGARCSRVTMLSRQEALKDMRAREVRVLCLSHYSFRLFRKRCWRRPLQ